MSLAEIVKKILGAEEKSEAPAAESEMFAGSAGNTPSNYSSNDPANAAHSEKQKIPQKIPAAQQQSQSKTAGTALNCYEPPEQSTLSRIMQSVAYSEQTVYDAAAEARK